MFITRKTQKFLAVLIAIICFTSAMIPAQKVYAKTTTSYSILNVYDNGTSYSAKYEVKTDFGTLKGSVLGKKYKIEGINFCKVLSQSDCNYFKKYARYNVDIYNASTGKFVKYISNLKNGDTFTLKSGSYRVYIYSSIASAGWSDFSNHIINWNYARYRLNY